MADQFDILLRSLADEADAKVDYAAMREAVLKKSAERKRRRARAARYGAMAASLVILLGAGTLYLAAGGGPGRAAENSAAPQAAPGSFGLFNSATDLAESITEQQPAAAADVPAPDAPAGAAGRSAADGDMKSDGLNSLAEEQEGGAEPALPEAAPEPTGVPGTGNASPLESAASGAEPVQVVFDVDELRALYGGTESSGEAALPPAEWLYAPAAAPEGYRLIEITAAESGVTYRYNRAVSAYDDEYALFIPAASLSGTPAPLDGAGCYTPAAEDILEGPGLLSWPLGDGTATLTPKAGCTLSLAELRAYCALRPVELRGN